MAVGFWSYAHRDDESARGGVLRLAAAIAEEYDLLTGRTLEMFVDRDGLAWGDNWKERIDAGLAGATFFIPVVTPRYFNRPECRREFVDFSAQARSLGLEEFILPIRYVPVPDLDVDSPDELKATVARTQYVDWSELRLLDESSGEYRRALHELAARLVDIESRMVEVQREAETSPEGDDDLSTLIDRITRLLPDWHEATVDNRTTSAQFWATFEAYRHNRRRTSDLSALIRFGREIQPLNERWLREARTYSARSIELDPLMTSLLRELADYPEGLSLTGPILDAVEDAHDNIVTSVKRTDKGALGMIEFFGRHARLSPTFKTLHSQSTEIDKLANEGNAIVERWATGQSGLRKTKR
ncbi:toll/interleukin-1 receptor domain-containing protein [Saccharothrix violaceirubra]|uniref:TIR domain-containing protein n=1 Tax=Saccharothrix violaceirubra TaxID=413306 RepID=A0A7W7WZ79_9PSEU|nr:toll/interleukin-1 receptor domain-containing protein [Saccharothrix violaceirubra]MBB4969017.1 hypothetical protein [Saccharothrix violaceirubra]